MMEVEKVSKTYNKYHICVFLINQKDLLIYSQLQQKLQLLEILH